MAIGAGPSYVNAVMGQTLADVQREHHVRKTSLQITARHDIEVAESEQPQSRPDSIWSMHCDRTDQAPYSTAVHNSTMTHASILNLPKSAETRELAKFLKTTGPTAPHRRPSKIEQHPRRISTPKNALRFLRFGHKRSQTPVFPAFEEEKDEAPDSVGKVGDPKLFLHDEGSLLFGNQKSKRPQLERERDRRMVSPWVQEVSSAGQKYLAIVPKSEDAVNYGKQPATAPPNREQRCVSPVIEDMDTSDLRSPAVLDSEVSISYADSINSPEVFDIWMCHIANEEAPRRSFSPSRKSSAHLPLRVVNPSSPASMRRHASNPPSPEPLSAVSMADSYKSELSEHPANRSTDAARALTSHPVHSTTTSLPPPKVALPHEEFPVRHLRSGRDLDIKHPSPRRFASHPVLLQRASSITSSLYPRSTTDSPGPPPRSPLRLRRDQRTIDDALAERVDRDATPRPGISCSEVSEYRRAVTPIKPTVITECTGPIKRPDSRERTLASRPSYSNSRKDREERIKARKLRDKPPASKALETLANVSPRSARQRLKKTRPQISIPDLRPGPLNTRTSSSRTSSNASGKKMTEFARTPVSAVPSETTPISATGYTPISPTLSSGSVTANEVRMTLSPVMLVAEEVPVQKAKSPHRPARLVVREGKSSYTPRPRSASIPRNALKRKSISRSRPSTRANSPAPEPQDDEAPPLPSPPPSRKLPPTPPASGSEKPRKGEALPHGAVGKELPPTPMHWLASPSLPTAGGAEQQVARTSDVSKSGGTTRQSGEFGARLAALEHQNKLLSAALMAVLKTNGERNLPLAELAAFAEAAPKTPAAWETRMARRKASDAASSSNGSALEMYMSTRRGSRHGF